MRTPAMRAMNPGRPLTIALLLLASAAGTVNAGEPQQQVNLTISSNSRPAPLVEAVKRGDAAMVRSLLAGRPGVDVVNATAADGATALHWAVQRDSVDLTEQLLRA